MRALITGASKGIGRALALQLAQHGYDLIISARDEQLLQDLAQQVQNQYQINVQVLPLDLALPDAAQQLIQQIEQAHLEIDCLVNNVGLGYLGAFTSMSTHRLQAMLNLYMNILTELSHHYARAWVSAGKQGKILQVASVAGFQPGPWMAVYYASKAYALNLSMALHYELKNKGITVTTLCPGPTQTEFLHSAKMDDSALAKGMIGMMTAEQVAAAGYRAMVKGKKYIVPGIFNKILGFSSRIAPTRMSMFITAHLHKMGWSAD